jgi:SNF2 family DNA or RNA helicase
MQDIGNRLLPVLEPLCQATSTLLKPLALNDRDRLEVNLDEEGRRFIVQAFAVGIYNSEQRTTASKSAAQGWVKKIPERMPTRDKAYGRWILAGTDFTALVIHHQWREDQLVWGSESARNLYRFLLMRFLVQSKASLIGARFKVDRVAPQMPDDFVEHPELPLADYQRVGLMMSLEQSAFLAGMQQGTGKTPLAIARICLESARIRKAENRMMRVLIVCPGQVRRNWENELERFSVSPGKVGVLRGGPVSRIKHLTDAIRDEPDCDFGAAVVSYDSVDRTSEALAYIPWDLVILDEIHYVKNPGTLRFKSLRELRENCRQIMGLTGTPITNSVMDLWSQFEVMGDGLSGFQSFKNFRSFYGKFEKSSGNGNAIERLVAVKNVPLIQERLSRMAFMITKAEARLNLPDKTYDILEVQMSKRQADLYNTLQSELAARIDSLLENEDEKRISVEHILTMLLRLSQITAGHIRWDTPEGMPPLPPEQIDVENAKANAITDAITEELNEDPNGKKIIWSCFVEDIRIQAKVLHERGIPFTTYHSVVEKGLRSSGVEESVRVFNENPEVKVFIGNPASAAEGINLLGYDYWNAQPVTTTYTDHEFFFSTDWSAVKRSQAEDRAHRRGTRSQSVQITDVVVPGTIDEEIRLRVLQKRKMAASIQDLRDILRSVLSSQVESDS